MKISAIITGSNGGIGKALVEEFKSSGYFTIGIDKDHSDCADINIICDLEKLVDDKEMELSLENQLTEALEKKELKVLINNAAIQILSSIEGIDLSDFKKTLNVNLVAPFLLSKLLFERLKKTSGSIINIGSIHAEQTKPKFIAYATSKAALKGMTQAMAVDFGKYVRVNNIQPSAIATEMLVDGFKDNPEGLDKLNDYHPSGMIGSPEAIAKLAVFVSGDDCAFMNGATIDVDGGVGVRLHDPD